MRRSIVAYAIFLALFNLSVLLPGNPVASVREMLVALAVQTFVLWRLWDGSTISWVVAMAFAAGYVVTVVLMQPPVDTGVILTFMLAIAQMATLLYARDRARPVSWPTGTPSSPCRQ